ncbi:MAG: PAC2 family protein [Anaerolineae bacterium]|nr:PAC2 family protein [Anaerolineae bacterium]MCO5199418.1 PAC2 family protein [Anaerolineae bacterium]MCO5206051.1 PAC2 family protein [Anaerolineae bacterium]
MSAAVNIWEMPQSAEITMLAGWRQWADAGSISSGLPQYLIDHLDARKIGDIRPNGFYLFQIPGTHDLVRPEIKLEDGYPVRYEVRRNDLYYAGDEQRGLVIFLGDEPHLDVERYAAALLDAAAQLGVRRIISFGGVYGELPYDKERAVSCIYSQRELQDELRAYAVTFSDYHGGSSIGSTLCSFARDRDVEYVGLYSFVPTYDFSQLGDIQSAIRLENDFMAWYGVMRRVNRMLDLNLDLDDLRQKSEKLVALMDEKVAELDGAAPQLGVRVYMDQLSADFDETVYDPLDAIWEDELRQLFDDFDDNA